MCVQIIVGLLLSTVAYGKLARLQWTGRAQGEADQFARRNLMKTFRSVLRTVPPQAPVRLVTQSVCIVLCGMLHESSRSILAIGNRCRLLTPTIAFVEANLYLVCAPEHREARLSRNGVVHERRLLHSARGFQQPQQPCLARRKPSLLHLLTSTNNVLRSTFGWALCRTFLFGLTCYPDDSVYRFTGCLWKKSYQKCSRKSRWHSRRNMWNQHDGTATHFARPVWEHLTIYNNRWIGQDRLVSWPPRSPDLTPMDFLVWGHIEPLIFTSPIDSEEDLIALSVRQRQPSRRNLAFLSAHVKLCGVVVGRVSRSVTARFNICSKLVLNTFLQTTSVGLFDFEHKSDPLWWSVALPRRRSNI